MVIRLRSIEGQIGATFTIAPLLFAGGCPMITRSVFAEFQIASTWVSEWSGRWGDGIVR
jgi:hypothetical protein